MNTPTPQDSAPPESDEGLATVLVVDDDPQNLLAMEVALQAIRCRQVQVRSGAAALRELLRQEFAVILLDVQMPDMDGFETARLIRSREKNRHVPILFVTAYSQDEADARRGYELGAVDYLFKPIVSEVLCAKVQALIELRDRAQQVSRQARQLRAMERAEAERRLAEERRNWEAEALRRHNEYLEETDRRKDEFLAVLAHELRNPMEPIVNSLEIMTVAGLHNPQLAKAHTVIERQVRHLTRLVDDLLDVSRISQGKLELRLKSLDLVDVASPAIEACETHVRDKEQTLELIPPQEPLIVTGDAVRLVQVVANLLHNASRYSERGSHIQLKLEADSDDALVRVRDEGIGISLEAQGRIFDRFIQERAGGNGLGLGLSLVKQIVQLHGGSVSVKSQGPGTGSEFLVRLPRADQNESETPPISIRPSDLSSVSESPCFRIALVEDDGDIRETLTMVLEQWGHTVESAADGREGVELVCRMLPDVALLDIGLPGLNGHGVAEAICERLGDSRPHLIALSGYGQKSDRLRSRQAGFDEHLVKPAQPNVLKRVLSEIQRSKV